ncbi:beta-glucosidase 24-like [Vigna unguiculata]|uniref:beta-glucosidase 24-like n=1 Tax=Vigna unguiculata TaxID=3917 RepID=UPI001016A512|nr:beta-glucosidase 24-like [Vigna unguiculata]
MARRGFILLLFFALTTLSTIGFAQHQSSVVETLSLNRSSFPTGFVFGTASSAYQYEGAANEGGRKPSIWDAYTHTYPGFSFIFGYQISGEDNGDVAIDQYHRYKEDVQIMKDMNLDAYRLSISWSRILPNGKLSGGVNPEGIRYYNNLIDNLLANGIEPYVTLFHWDLPQTLEEEYGGFLSRRVVDDFRDYAEICFKHFGNRVKYWITLNEPWSYTNNGYALGSFPPCRCSKWVDSTCVGGDSGTEPYIASHNLLLAHAAAVHVYKKKFQNTQKGVIGITLISHWFEPYSNSQADKDAAIRALDFMFGWYMEPLTSGRYPKSMRSLVGKRLPKFSKHEAKLVAGSYDFLGLNYYTTYYVADASKANKPSYTTDANANQLTVRNGVSIGPQFGPSWLFIYPKGIRKLLLYTNTTYNSPSIYITENGMGDINTDPTLSVKEMLQDTYRIDYYYRHLYYILSATRDGIKVKGYFAWSLLDNFEWKDGYQVRFGLNFVDYKNGLKRHAKQSAKWFQNFLRKD